MASIDKGFYFPFRLFPWGNLETVRFQTSVVGSILILTDFVARLDRDYYNGSADTFTYGVFNYSLGLDLLTSCTWTDRYLKLSRITAGSWDMKFNIFYVLVQVITVFFLFSRKEVFHILVDHEWSATYGVYNELRMIAELVMWPLKVPSNLRSSCS